MSVSLVDILYCILLAFSANINILFAWMPKRVGNIYEQMCVTLKKNVAYMNIPYVCVYTLCIS